VNYQSVKSVDSVDTESSDRRKLALWGGLNYNPYLQPGRSGQTEVRTGAINGLSFTVEGSDLMTVASLQGIEGK